MMLRKKLAAAVFLSVMTFAGAAASEDEACMLNAGCYLVSGSDTSPPYWVCPDPGTYMLCVS